MDNYLSVEAFTKATDKAALRKVAYGGSISLDGRRYESRELIPYAGQYVRAFVDLNGADAICFTPFDRCYICNAQNPELWTEMIAEAYV